MHITQIPESILIGTIVVDYKKESRIQESFKRNLFDAKNIKYHNLI